MPQESDQSYLLAEDSQFESVEVDGEQIGKYGEGVALTSEQVERVNAIEGVELVSAGSQEQSQEEQPSPETPEQE